MAAKNKLHKATTAHVMRALDKETVTVSAKWRPTRQLYDVYCERGGSPEEYLGSGSRDDVYTLIVAWIMDKHIDRYSLVWRENEA